MSEAHPQPSPEGVPGAVTDPSGILGHDLIYPGHGGDDINAYLAAPVEEGARAGIIVIHEAGGLGEHIRDVVNRFANIGYVALGVDLYTREGGPPPAGDMRALFARLFAMPDERVLGDLDAAADLLRAREDSTGKVGCIGFCMGGRYTLLFASARAQLDAAVDCWGGFIDKATTEERSTPERPTPPLELAPQISCALYAAFGEEDQNPSPELAGALMEAAAKSGHEALAEVYENASHAFFADYRPSYRPEPAQRLWEHVVPFLDRHLRLGQGPPTS
jgi:carboxymethylenebutenolidase